MSPSETSVELQPFAIKFAVQYPGEFVRCLEQLQNEQRQHTYTLLPHSVVVLLLPYFRREFAAEILSRLEDRVFTTVCEKTDTYLLSQVCAFWPMQQREEKLALLTAAQANEVRELMRYPADVAGGIMRPDIVAYQRQDTAAFALEKIRMKKRRVTDIYVVDQNRSLVGKMTLQALALAEPDMTLGELMKPNPLSVKALDPVSEVTELIEKNKLMSVPVVDIDGVFVGVVLYQNLFDAVEQDATSMLQSMVGVSPDERALSNVRFAVKKRIGWLMVNLMTTFLAAYVVGLFESTIAQFTALAILLPVVAGQSGNTGMQALAVISRGIALREIRLKHALRVIIKESAVGIFNGLLVGVVCALGVYLWSHSMGLAFVIGLAMVLAMFAAGLSGAVIPLLLTALKQDPAHASSIVLTTVTDVVGFLSFLGLATVFAHWLG